MAYKYLTDRTSPNKWKGRPDGPPDGIVIHYWGDPKAGATFDGVVSWLCRPGGNTSAHYVVEAGKVACIVAPGDRAWHAMSANARKIGIECNPRMSAGDLETTAELIADLREFYGPLPLSPHDAYTPTSCPGPYKQKLAWLDKRANQIMADRKKKPVKPAATTKEEGEGFLMALTDKQQQKLYDTTLVMGKRVRQLKDYETMGGPDGHASTISRKILTKLDAIESRLTKLEEGAH